MAGRGKGEFSARRKGLVAACGALIAGLLRAGLAAEKEGVKMASAVSPPICYGKIRVSPEHDKDTTRQRLAAARAAATTVLVEGGCDLAR